MKKLILTISFSSLLSLMLIAQSAINDTCIVLQPGWEEGVDAQLASCAAFGYDTTNYGNIEDITSIAWTRQGQISNTRSLFWFDVGVVPPGYVIDSAKLSLYAVNSPSNGQHSTLSGSNASVLQRVTTYWQESLVTWNTMPQTTTQNEVTLPASTSPIQDYIDIDVTQLVKDMRNNPNSSYGFMLRLQNEQYYRKMVFASSDHPDASKHPKLVICMHNVNASVSESAQKTGVKIFPNPVNQQLNIQLGTVANTDMWFTIYNVAGQKIMEMRLQQGGQKYSLPVELLTKGLYFYQLRNDSELVSSGRFVKE